MEDLFDFCKNCKYHHSRWCYEDGYGSAINDALCAEKEREERKMELKENFTLDIEMTMTEAEFRAINEFCHTLAYKSRVDFEDTWAFIRDIGKGLTKIKAVDNDGTDINFKITLTDN